MLKCDHYSCEWHLKTEGICIFDQCRMEKKNKICPLCKDKMKDFEMVCVNCEYESLN